MCKGEDVDEEQAAQVGPLKDVLESSKKEMKIKSRKDYPLSKPFPTHLRKLFINNCGLVKFDNRISKLTGLTVLNLNENKLSELPDSLAGLSNLKELYLANNSYTVVPDVIFKQNIQSTLRLLDMSTNQLKDIPPQISCMEKLTNLKLDNNKITFLPYNIELLISLKYLSVARNNLRILPHGFCKLNIDSLDLSGNPLDTNAAYCVTVNNLENVPTLFEIAARLVRERQYVMYKFSHKCVHRCSVP